MSGYFARITPVHGGHPDQGLPDWEAPVDPGYGVGGDHVWPPATLPPLPPGVWPNPPVGTWPPSRPNLPSHPIVIYPPRPDQGLPPSGNRPDQGLPGSQPGVDNTLPMPPATIWPPLPPGTGVAGKALILVWVVGVGYRWLVVGATDIWPPQPVKPDHSLPPTPQPKS
jgi:hypothetical protein